MTHDDRYLPAFDERRAVEELASQAFLDAVLLERLRPRTDRVQASVEAVLAGIGSRGRRTGVRWTLAVVAAALVVALGIRTLDAVRPSAGEALGRCRAAMVDGTPRLYTLQVDDEQQVWVESSGRDFRVLFAEGPMEGRRAGSTSGTTWAWNAVGDLAVAGRQEIERRLGRFGFVFGLANLPVLLDGFSRDYEVRLDDRGWWEGRETDRLEAVLRGESGPPDLAVIHLDAETGVLLDALFEWEREPGEPGPRSVRIVLRGEGGGSDSTPFGRGPVTIEELKALARDQR